MSGGNLSINSKVYMLDSTLDVERLRTYLKAKEQTRTIEEYLENFFSLNRIYMNFGLGTMFSGKV